MGVHAVPSLKNTFGPSKLTIVGFMTTRPRFKAFTKPSSTATVTPSLIARLNAPLSARGTPWLVRSPKARVCITRNRVSCVRVGSRLPATAERCVGTPPNVLGATFMPDRVESHSRRAELPTRWLRRSTPEFPAPTTRTSLSATSETFRNSPAWWTSSGVAGKPGPARYDGRRVGAGRDDHMGSGHRGVVREGQPPARRGPVDPRHSGVESDA